MQAKFRKLLSVAIALAGCAAIHPAQALTADGLTYTLTAFATPNPTVADLTLTISGINGAADAEGGRYGVFAIAFNDPSGFAQITGVPAGFTPVAGGLSSGNGGGGCDGHGSSFYCVQNAQPITQATLAANSTLNFNFTVNLSGFNPAAAADYEDDFKISWDGSKSDDYGGGDFKSGYDHVSENLTLSPAAAPEIDPGSASAALTLLAGGLAMLRGRRRKS
jgi:hypothetical protein